MLPPVTDQQAMLTRKVATAVQPMAVLLLIITMRAHIIKEVGELTPRQIPGRLGTTQTIVRTTLIRLTTATRITAVQIQISPIIIIQEVLGLVEIIIATSLAVEIVAVVLLQVVVDRQVAEQDVVEIKFSSI